MFVIQAWAGPGTGTHICRVSVSGEQVKLFGEDIRELGPLELVDGSQKYVLIRSY